jgi:Fic family protein
MPELPAHPAINQDHFSALSRRRDQWLREAKTNPSGAVQAIKALTFECVTQTLLLTGVSITKEEVKRVAESAGPESQNRVLISGQFQALRTIQDAVRSGPSLTQSLICEVNRFSTPDSGGVFRRGPGRSQFAGITPPAHPLIAGRLENLIDWLAARSGRSLHLPARAALAFVRLLEISPFERGNFRTAHLLLNYFAFVENFPPLFLRAGEAGEVRKDVERGLGFDTLPLATRLARAQAASLSFCLEALNPPA